MPKMRLSLLGAPLIEGDKAFIEPKPSKAAVLLAYSAVSGEASLKDL